MPIDPLLGPRRPRRDVQPDPAGHLLALALVLASMALVIGAAELFARTVLDRPAAVDVVSLPATSVVATAQSVPAAAAAPGRRHAPKRCDWVLPLLERHGLPTWMIAVAHRESRCIADVVNDDTGTRDLSYGLFQINTLGNLWGEVNRRCGVVDRGQLLDADTNVACAAALYRAYGYRPWDSGRYFR